MTVMPTPPLQKTARRTVGPGWKDLVERKLIDELVPDPCARPDVAIGQILASAVFHGAFLTRHRLGSLHRALARPPFKLGELVWFDLELTETRGRYEDSCDRWFVDPITRALLAHRTVIGTKQSQGAEECLAAFLEVASEETSVAVDRFFELAERKWRFSMPGVIFAHAKGETCSIPISANDWHRVVESEKWEPSLKTRNMRPRDAAARAQYRTSLAEKRAGEEERRAARRHLKQFRRKELFKEYGWADLYASLKKGSSYKGGSARKLAEYRRKAKQELAALCDNLPHKILLSCWAQYALSAKSRGSKGLMPSTVLSYLTSLMRDVFNDDGAMDVSTVDDLLPLIAERIPEIETDSRRDTAIAASRSLFRQLEASGSNIDWDRFNDEIGAHARPGRVNANLVSPRDYSKLLSACRTIDQQLAFILGYRLGLRESEVVGIELDDFHDFGSGIELSVQGTAKHRLKTPTSRRVIPLSAFLEPNELTAVRSRLETLRSRAAIEDSDRRFIRASRRKNDLGESHSFKRQLEHILQTEVDGGLDFKHLRHTFATYLLTTMLLPEDTPKELIPPSLRSVISHDRRDRVKGVMVGDEALGLQSLHAVSQLMGHLPSSTTLTSYAHLMDLSAAQFSWRAARLTRFPTRNSQTLMGRCGKTKSLPDTVRPRERHRRRLSLGYVKPYLSTARHGTGSPGCGVNASDFGQRLKRRERISVIDVTLDARKMRSAKVELMTGEEPHDWRDIVAVLRHDFAVPIHVPEQKAQAWRCKAEEIFAITLRRERGTKFAKYRHDSSVLEIANSQPWIDLVDARWLQCTGVNVKRRLLLRHALEHWDTRRCEVRFKSSKEAKKFRDLLVKELKFRQSEIRIRSYGQRYRLPKTQKDRHEDLSKGNIEEDRGKSGSISIGFKEVSRKGAAKTRHIRSAGLFLLMMHAILSEG